jgi:hypothetical protein
MPQLSESQINELDQYIGEVYAAGDDFWTLEALDDLIEAYLW